jgi:hypothetical protein
MFLGDVPRLVFMFVKICFLVMFFGWLKNISYIFLNFLLRNICLFWLNISRLAEEHKLYVSRFFVKEYLFVSVKYFVDGSAYCRVAS